MRLAPTLRRLPVVPEWARASRRRARGAALRRLESDGDPTIAAVGRALAASVAAPSAGEAAWIDRIESLRAALGASDDVLPAMRAESPDGTGRRGTVDASVSRLALEVSKPARWGRVLLNLARELGPATSLELGTCIGLSTAYQAAGLELGGGHGCVVTLELRAPRVELAKSNLGRLGLGHRVDARQGRFRETLEDVAGMEERLGFAFVDGDHKKRPTLRYFERILARLEPAGGVVLFDDITWSRGMRRAWAEISDDRRVALAANLLGLGLCVVRGKHDAEGIPHRIDVPLHA